MGVYPITDF